MALNITRHKYSQTDQMIKQPKIFKNNLQLYLKKIDINVIQKRKQKIKKN